MRPKEQLERHWDSGNLLRRLYGLDPEGGAADEHLNRCSECSERWEALLSTRSVTLNEAAAAPIAEDRLVSQRRALWSRIDHPRRFWFSKWTPVAATAMMLVAGLVLLHPQNPVPTPASQAQSGAAASISDAQLFSDLSTMSAPAAPLAAEPIRGLFEGSSSEQEESF